MGWLRRRILSGIASLALVSGIGLPQAQAEDFQLKPAVSILEPTTRLLSDITTAGNQLVAVGERGLVLTSHDSGQTWNQSSVPVSATLSAVSFATEELGWAVGHAGVILHTADGGKTWHLQFDGNEANRQWLAYTQRKRASLEARVAALEAEGDPEGLLDDLQYELEDATFNQEDAEAALETGPADPLLDVLFTSPAEGWAVGAYGMVFHTRDGGQTWVLATERIANPDRYHFYAIARDAAGNLYLSGEAGLLYHSNDNGKTWTRNEDVYIGSLFGLVTRNNSVYTFGLRGNIFRSTDAGASWTTVSNPTAFSLYGGNVISDGSLLLVGAGGGTLRIGPQGQLQTGTQPSRSTLSSVAQGKDGSIVLVGMDGAEKLAGAIGEWQ